MRKERHVGTLFKHDREFLQLAYRQNFFDTFPSYIPKTVCCLQFHWAKMHKSKVFLSDRKSYYLIIKGYILFGSWHSQLTPTTVSQSIQKLQTAAVSFQAPPKYGDRKERNVQKQRHVVTLFRHQRVLAYCQNFIDTYRRISHKLCGAYSIIGRKCIN